MSENLTRWCRAKESLVRFSALQQVVSLKFVVKSAAANIEDRRGFFLVSCRRRQSHGDKLLFRRFEGHADMDWKACQERLAIRLSSISDSRRKKIGGELFTFRYQDRALDNILELTHIAGPGITFETSERVRGN